MSHRPAECARNVRSATNETPSGTLRPPALRGLPEGEELLSVSLSYLVAPPLTFSIVHVPSHVGSEAEKGRQVGEASGNFSVLFSSLGNKIGIH